MPEAAICVQDIDVQCVLQFTLLHAAGCALHRHTSRVIHRLELYQSSSVTDKFASKTGSCRLRRRRPTVNSTLVNKKKYEDVRAGRPTTYVRTFVRPAVRPSVRPFFKPSQRGPFDDSDPPLTPGRGTRNRYPATQSVNRVVVFVVCVCLVTVLASPIGATPPDRLSVTVVRVFRRSSTTHEVDREPTR